MKEGSLKFLSIAVEIGLILLICYLVLRFLLVYLQVGAPIPGAY